MRQFKKLYIDISSKTNQRIIRFPFPASRRTPAAATLLYRSQCPLPYSSSMLKRLSSHVWKAFSYEVRDKEFWRGRYGMSHSALLLCEFPLQWEQLLQSLHPMHPPDFFDRQILRIAKKTATAMISSKIIVTAFVANHANIKFLLSIRPAYCQPVRPVPTPLTVDSAATTNKGSPPAQPMLQRYQCQNLHL